MLGFVTIGRQAFDEAFLQPKNKFTFLDAGPDAEPALTAAAPTSPTPTCPPAPPSRSDYTEGFSSS